MPKVRQSGIIFLGRVPKWLRSFCVRVRELLNLEEFYLEVRYIDLKAANAILRRAGYSSLAKGDAASVIIDMLYLDAVLLFLRPMRHCVRALEIVYHEMSHIHLRAKVFSRVSREFLDHYLPTEFKDMVYDAMLKIEETEAEQLTRLAGRLGLFVGAPA
jgi:hypothetical protein